MTRAWDGRLRRVGADDLPPLHRDAVDAETLAGAAGIVRDVERDGEAAVRAHAERLGDIAPGAPLVLDRAALQAALDAVAPETRALLERVAGRIHDFADAQADALESIDVRVPGGEAGHTVCAVDRAGCYAPGGRFPLPSSVLMTAVTARAAGVGEIWVASPRPAPVTIAAAAVAGADALLAVGGAQAIAALAYGAGAVPPCDVVVGPGNRWVTAAKQLVSGRVRIDMLAGPSELVVFADRTGDPAVIAADLLAQAEHDDDALPVLVTTDAALADAVDAALVEQLSDLPTAATASRALHNGFTVLVDDADAGVAVCDRLAPEHLQVHLADAEAVVPRLRHYGGLFVGAGAAEVFGDYGIGPNHVLPTGGTGRFTGGLSVFDFLRVRTWLRVPDGGVAASIVQDTVALARLEGLEAHARAALARRTG
jgi:phosphoribosyl-ATP pyrophosphohydrolase/phosphoribosyl-AMP cyclohydrolase/histidinol dehydrogenase